MSSQGWVIIDGVLNFSGSVAYSGNIAFTPTNTYDIGNAAATVNPAHIYSQAVITNNASFSGVLIGSSSFNANDRTELNLHIADGVAQFTNNAQSGFSRLILGTNDATTNGASWLLNGTGDLTARSGDGTSARNVNVNAVISAQTNPASGGFIRAANLDGIYFRNAGNTADILALASNGSNEIVLGDPADTDTRIQGAGILLNPGSGDIRWNKALVALGGGSTATLGTIGGSGPATVAQNTWMRVLDSTGAAFWVPAWK